MTMAFQAADAFVKGDTKAVNYLLVEVSSILYGERLPVIVDK